MINKREMTFEEMAQLVDETREANHYHGLAEQEKWEREQRDKARAVVTKLEKQLPPELWQEVLDLTDTRFGGSCIRRALFEKAGRSDFAQEGDLPF